MRVHAICFVKDEGDVIAQTLTAALGWCDHVYVWDNGSTDGSWETVQELGRAHAQIVPFRQDARPFREWQKAEVYAHFRDAADPGDWWGRLDADEVYIDDPRAFLAGVPDRYRGVWSAHFNYYFSDVDLARYRESPASYGPDVPVQDKLRYYRNSWSELRFWRCDDRTRWTDAWPSGLGRIYPERIRLRHYQYRSPEQIQRRLDARYELMRGGGHSFHHEVKKDWQGAMVDRAGTAVEEDASARPHWTSRVVPAEKLTLDTGGPYRLREDLMPRLPRYSQQWLFTTRVGRTVRRVQRAARAAVGRVRSAPRPAPQSA